MYRQIDPHRNVSAIKRETFPDHIKVWCAHSTLKNKILPPEQTGTLEYISFFLIFISLLFLFLSYLPIYFSQDYLLKEIDWFSQVLQTTLQEENERKQRQSDFNLQKYKIYYFDQRTQQMANIRLFLSSDTTLEEALDSAHKRLKLTSIVPMSRCRLIAYDSNEENVLSSFDGKDAELLRDLLSEFSSSELLLEIREDGAKFDIYVPGDIETKVYTVDTCSADIDGPHIVRIHKNATVKLYKKKLAQQLNVPVDDIVLATFKYSSSATILEHDDVILSDEDVSILQWYLYIENILLGSKFKMEIGHSEDSIGATKVRLLFFSYVPLKVTCFVRKPNLLFGCAGA